MLLRGYISDSIGFGPAPPGLEAYLEERTRVDGEYDRRSNAHRILRDWERKLNTAQRIDYRAGELPTNG